jgi:hypothetical protein
MSHIIDSGKSVGTRSPLRRITGLGMRSLIWICTWCVFAATWHTSPACGQQVVGGKCGICGTWYSGSSCPNGCRPGGRLDPPPPPPSNTYGVVRLHNKTSRDVTYSIRSIRNSEWSTNTLEPGKRYFHWTRPAANFAIEFGAAGRHGRYTLDANLMKGREPVGDDGRDYEFVERDGRVDLYKTTARSAPPAAPPRPAVDPNQAVKDALMADVRRLVKEGEDAYLRRDFVTAANRFERVIELSKRGPALKIVFNDAYHKKLLSKSLWELAIGARERGSLVEALGLLGQAIRICPEPMVTVEIIQDIEDVRKEIAQQEEKARLARVQQVVGGAPASSGPEPNPPVAEPTTPVAEPKTPVVDPKTPVVDPKTPVVEPKTPAAEPKKPAVAAPANPTPAVFNALCKQARDANARNCSGFVRKAAELLGHKLPVKNANQLVDYFNDAKNGWVEVDADTAQALADAGHLVIAGKKADEGSGHVVIVAPGGKVHSGGYSFVDKNTKQTMTMRDHGSYPRMWGTGAGSWPGVESRGEKSVYDAWGSEKNYKGVKYWKAPAKEAAQNTGSTKPGS